MKAGADLFTDEADQLQSGNPRSWPVAPSWQPCVERFFQSDAGSHLLDFLNRRLKAGASIFPPMPLRALDLTPLGAVHTVILGQDPYHGRGQAEGLAFSVASGSPIPPSLRNIFKELERDLGQPFPAFPVPGGSLVDWAQRGVLLLNSCLTVEEGQPASHTGRGWEVLTDDIVRRVSSGERRVAFFLWGAHAQSKISLIDESRHLVLRANHPSPLAARRAPTPYLGCSHFSQAMEWHRQLQSNLHGIIRGSPVERWPSG